MPLSLSNPQLQGKDLLREISAICVVMGACCSNREGRPVNNTSHVQLQLYQSKNRLQDIHKRLQKLNLHLSYFQHKASDYKHLLRDLKHTQHEYLDRHIQLGVSVELMNDLLGQLDTEVQAQFISERESTDLSREELMTVIKGVRAQKQAEKLESLSTSLQTYIQYPAERVEFDSKVGKSIDEVKITSTSLLGYMRFVEECKKGAAEAVQGLGDASSISGDEKWEDKVRKWEQLRKNTRKLADDLTAFSQGLLKAYQKIVEELETLKQEVNRYFEQEGRTGRASEVHSAAQNYITLLASERRSIPRKSRGSTGPSSPLIPGSKSGSVYMEEFQEGLRRLCILNHYRDGEVMSESAAYDLLLALVKAKDEADRQAAHSDKPPLPLELFLLSFLATQHNGRDEVKAEALKFTGALDRLASTRLGQLSLELLKFAESDPLSIHEEVFICKALAQLHTQLQPQTETWETGGSVVLYSAIQMVEQWFGTEPETGALVVPGLAPNLQSIDLAVYYVKARLVELNKSAEQLFYDLDTRKANNIPRDQFTSGLKQLLRLQLPDECLEELGKLLDKTASNGIFRTELNELFRTDSFKAESCRTSCMDVVAALRTAYTEWKSELSSQLYLEFILVPLNDYKVKISDAAGLIQDLDPELTSQQVSTYLQKLETSVGPSFPFESFREFFLLNPIGPSALSYFSNSQLACSGLTWAQGKAKVPDLVVSILRGRKSESRV